MTTQELKVSESPAPLVVIRIASPDGRRAQTARIWRGRSVVVGTDRSCDLVVDDRAVSGRHVEIRHDGDSIRARDLDSRNGTYVLGHRLSTVDVGIGTVLTVGQSRIELLQIREAPLEEVSEVLPELVGASLPMRRLAGRVRQVAKIAAPVVVLGPSGCGKELVARALHRESERPGRLVAINAATLSGDLAESELFGHRRGGFTGATQDRLGAFREANRGTLFIDEIARLGLEVQAKLLRVVEEHAVRPVGADGVTQVDVRLVTATCEPLEALVCAGRFRRDLYERIAICVVRVPALRDRLEDLAMLARHLLDTSGFGDHRLSSSAERALMSLRFEGNVRELRALLMLAAMTAGPRGTLTAEDVHAAVAERTGRPLALTAADAEHAVHLFGNQVQAAKHLGMPRTTFRDLLNSEEPRRRSAPRRTIY